MIIINIKGYLHFLDSTPPNSWVNIQIGQVIAPRFVRGAIRQPFLCLYLGDSVEVFRCQVFQVARENAITNERNHVALALVDMVEIDACSRIR